MLKRLRNNLKNKKGFTMVELIVVIVIILVLSAALVPQLLKYVDQANRANCQSEAATLLAQVQADYTASLAKDQTGVSVPEKIQGVTIKAENADVSVSTTIGDNTAVYYVETTSSDSGVNPEITSFGYCNGKFKAIWTVETKWHVYDKKDTKDTTGTTETEEEGTK